MSVSIEYVIGSDVYCYHGPCMYPAKVKKLDEKKNAFYIKYNGWKDKWNEWVGADRLLPINDETKAQAAELMRSAKESKLKGKSKAKNTAPAAESSASNNKGGKKRKLEEDDDGIAPAMVGFEGEFNVKLSGVIKKQLVSDWENVCRNQKIVSLPRTPNVASILDEFHSSVKEGRRVNEVNLCMTAEVLKGIKTYFDKALGTVLLYRFERPQYKDVLEKYPTLPMSEVYGIEHLVRLFVKLPSLLNQTKLSEEEVEVLSGKLNEFMKWLEKKTGYCSTYVGVDQDYLARVEPHY